MGSNPSWVRFLSGTQNFFFVPRRCHGNYLQYLECQKDLGIENGEISDRQISASSQLDASHAATQGRLNLKKSWSAFSNDLSQWLQVDLSSPYTKVTRVATQGRKDAPQWVTKYKLQFSNDGVKLRYYTDPIPIGSKVKQL